MSFNLSQLPAAKRTAIQYHRQCCFESYQRQQELDAQLAVDAAWEYGRLMSAREEKKGGWRDWVRQQLLAMDDPQLVARLTRRLSLHIKAGSLAYPS